MRVDRLVLDSAGTTLRLDFHPRLTVVGGLDPQSRDALAAEILDALGHGRPGVHVELRCRGRALTVVRAAGQPALVHDTDDDIEVTERFRGADGTVDILAANGVDRVLARSTLRLTGDDLAGHREDETWITRLAAVDQHRLWAAAQQLRATERELEHLAEDVGTGSEDAGPLEELEERHRQLVDATDSYARSRLVALTLSAVGTMVGLAGLVDGALTDGALTDRGLTEGGVPGWTLVGSLALATAGLLLAVVLRRRVRRAEVAERAALEEAGADDYRSFHRARVAALLESDRHRRRFMMAVGDHRRAVTAWEDLAGEIPVPFAVNHEPQIRAAAKLRARAIDGAGSALERRSDHGAAPLAQAVMARLDAVQALTGRQDCCPLVVEDAFVDLDTPTAEALLDLLESQSSRLQVIVLTADERVRAWARAIDDPARLSCVEPRLGVRTSH